MIARARRRWLAAVALGLGALLAPAAAGAAPARAPARPEPAKKDRALRAKSTRHGRAAPPGARPVKLINFHNFWTKEWLAVDPARPPPGRVIDRFLRDHYTNRSTAMQPRLLRAALAAAAHFQRDVVEVVSGFRHPKYNLILRKKGHQVARDSQHSHGSALDFYLPDVPVGALRAWAVAQKLGGVGIYLHSGFVHMDTGPIRTWSGD